MQKRGEAHSLKVRCRLSTSRLDGGFVWCKSYSISWNFRRERNVWRDSGDVLEILRGYSVAGSRLLSVFKRLNSPLPEVAGVQDAFSEA